MSALGVAFEVEDEALGADLRAGADGPGQVGDVHAGLGAVAAALVAEAAVDAGGARCRTRAGCRAASGGDGGGGGVEAEAA